MVTEIAWLLRVSIGRNTLSIHLLGRWLLRIQLRKGWELEEFELIDRAEIGLVRVSLYRLAVRGAVQHSRSSSKVILGLCGSFHDSAAVLLRDGRIVAALDEERVTRRKHDGPPFPIAAITRLLAKTQIGWTDIDHIALGWDYNQYKTTRHGRAPGEEAFRRIHEEYARERRMDVGDVRRRDVFERNRARFRPEAIKEFLELMAIEAGEKHAPRVSFVRHHWAHAASAYFASGFREPTLVVTLDGYGDTETTTVWLGKGGKLRLLESIPIPHSLGWVYASMTEYLGFTPLHSEGEVMGLAPYGAPRSPSEVRLAESLSAFMDEFVRLEAKGKFRVNGDYLYFGDFSPGYSRVSRAMIDRLRNLVPVSGGNARKPDPDLIVDRPRVIAAWALQKKIEETIVHIVRYYIKEDRRTLGTQAVALAGGVAYNITANGRLISEGLVNPSRLFVQPAAGDAGAALGAAMLVARDVYGCDPSFRMCRADLGPACTDQEMVATLDSYGLKAGSDYRVLGDEDTTAFSIAELLAQNKVVACFQGRSEFGPRALGFRSILLNAVDPKANAVANTVKRRSWWRPSAISITKEDAPAYLEDIGPDGETPFMNVALTVRKDKRNLLLSGWHRADGRSRPQTVTRDQNPLLWTLLHHLKELTGVPAVVNTSFNRNEPLVETPEEALNTFAYMEGVDVLALGRFLVTAKSCIIPSVCSLWEDSVHKRTLEGAGSSLSTSELFASFLHADGIASRGHRIVAVMKDERNCTRVMEWPLFKEFLSGHGGASEVQRYLCTELLENAMKFRATQVFVGSSSIRYDRVVYDIVKHSLRSYFEARDLEQLGKRISVARLCHGGTLCGPLGASQVMTCSNDEPSLFAPNIGDCDHRDKQTAGCAVRSHARD